MKMSLSTYGMEELTDALMRLSSSDFEPAVTEALTLGGEIAVKALREAADKHHGGGTGRMRDSITANDPTVSRWGGYLEIKLKGTVSKGWRYRDQGAELNYGSGRRVASGWFDEGTEVAQPEVEQSMVETLEAWIAASDIGA